MYIDVFGLGFSNVNYVMYGKDEINVLKCVFIDVYSFFYGGVL